MYPSSALLLARMHTHTHTQWGRWEPAISGCVSQMLHVAWIEGKEQCKAEAKRKWRGNLDLTQLWARMSVCATEHWWCRHDDTSIQTHHTLLLTVRQRKHSFLLCICGHHLHRPAQFQQQRAQNDPAETARRFLTSAWPCMSHLTSMCLSPSGWKLGKNTWLDAAREPGVPKSAI